MNSKTIFSFFSGCGILDLGFENAGFDIKFVNEYSIDFLRAYQYSRAEMGMKAPEYGYANVDINVFLNDRKAELKKYISIEHKLGNDVGFIGGPPCPDFSVGGKNKGRNGDNGKLSQSYVSLITEMKPDFFLFENVKGLWRTVRHREYYEELKAQLRTAGYSLTERLTNALEFGVPQDRDRILLIGVRSTVLKDPKKKIADFPWSREILYDINTIKSMPWPGLDPFHEDGDLSCPDGIIKPLTVEYWFKKNEVSTHPDKDRFFKPKGGLERMKTIEEGDTNKKSYKRIHRWRYSPTVCYGNNEVHFCCRSNGAAISTQRLLPSS
jgi:DNA (cytosine-5)-methyltransferase 1